MMGVLAEFSRTDGSLPFGPMSSTVEFEYPYSRPHWGEVTLMKDVVSAG